MSCWGRAGVPTERVSEMQPIVPARIGGDHRFGGGDDRTGGAEVARERDDGALAHAVLEGLEDVRL